jgi:Dual specificity phosphatase, catalytic domain
VKYALACLFLSVAFAAAAFTVWDSAVWLAILLLAASVSFAALAVAYGTARPGLLGKNEHGRRSLRAWMPFGPYFLLTAASFLLYRRTSRESAYVEVAPNLFFGRRLTNQEAITGNWRSVIDLAAEFAETRTLRDSPRYLSLPVLDATAPTSEQLRDAITRIETDVALGRVYVHCALGHGRSACVVIGYLLSAKEVKKIEEGIARIRSLRPAVRLNDVQIRRLRSFEA